MNYWIDLHSGCLKYIQITQKKEKNLILGHNWVMRGFNQTVCFKGSKLKRAVKSHTVSFVYAFLLTPLVALFTSGFYGPYLSGAGFEF